MNEKPTASASTSEKFICPANVQEWLYFERDVLIFFEDPQSIHKYQTWANKFLLPKLPTNDKILENKIQYYFMTNAIEKINDVLEKEEKNLNGSYSSPLKTKGRLDFVYYSIEKQEPYNIIKALIPIEIKRFENIFGSLVDKFKNEQESIQKEESTENSDPEYRPSEKRPKTTSGSHIEPRLIRTAKANLHNYHLVCQLFSYMAFNDSTLGIASTNNSSYFFKYNMDVETLYISNPIDCTYDGNSSKISLFKSIWYVLMEANDISLKSESEREGLIEHYKLLLPKKDDSEEDDREEDQPSTSTAAAQGQKRTRSGKPYFYTSSLKHVIGCGATGAVWYYENFYGQDIAVKLVDMAKNPKGFWQTKSEIEIYQILSEIQGECIPKIEFVFEGYPFLIVGMTLIGNNNKGDLLSRSLDEYEKESFGSQLKCIMDKIHKLKVTHNDIRLENILVDNDNKVWLIDFGRAQADSNEGQIKEDAFSVNFLLRCMNISQSTISESNDDSATAVEMDHSISSPPVLSIDEQSNSVNKSIDLSKTTIQDSVKNIQSNSSASSTCLQKNHNNNDQ